MRNSASFKKKLKPFEFIGIALGRSGIRRSYLRAKTQTDNAVGILGITFFVSFIQPTGSVHGFVWLGDDGFVAIVTIGVDSPIATVPVSRGG